MRSKFYLAWVVLVSTWCTAHAGPVITDFTPVAGYWNDPGYVYIYGSGFTGGALTVRFNGVTATTAYAPADDTIQTRVPQAAPLGSGRIYVKVGANDTQSDEEFWVIGPGPFVSGFTPNFGSDGTPVQITGVHFIAGGSPIVRFNGVIATLGAHNDVEINVTAPSGVTTGPISVQAPGISTFTTSNLFYANPTITGFTPFRGRTGTNVTIRGKNLTGTTEVRFGATPAVFTNQSNTQLVAIVPPYAMSGHIWLDTPANPTESGTNFQVEPTILGFTPPFATVGSSITVTGLNFNASGRVVRFGSIQAGEPSSVTFSNFLVTVPGTATNSRITLTTVDGTSTSSQTFYIPPSITSFTPVMAPPGATVKIYGNHFSDASAVGFNGTPAASFTYSNYTTLLATVPTNAITGPITVTTPGGTASSGTYFYGAPAIFSFTPAAGLPQTNVTIYGTNMLGVTSVQFGGANADIVNVINSSQVNTVVPAGAQTGPITVTSPSGSAGSDTDFVLYNSDLNVNADESPDPVFAGSNLVYTVEVVNNGPFAAPGVRLTNTLPATVALVNAVASQGSVSGTNPVVAAFGAVNNGSSATLTLSVTPQLAGSITNRASAGSGYPDSSPANNSHSLQTTVWPLPVLWVARATNHMEISWPAPLSNFTVQLSSPLGRSWSNLTVTPAILSNRSVITLTNTGSDTFFRLAH